MPRKRKLALSIMQENEEPADAIGVLPCLYDKSKNNSQEHKYCHVADQLQIS